MKYIYLLLLIICCSSCANFYYAPNTANVPLFKEANEVRVSVNGNIGDDFNGTEVQAAYSATENIGVMANYMYGKGGRFDHTGKGGKGQLGEVGVGYFQQPAPNLVFEVYGGMGFGNVKNWYHDTGYAGRSNINLVKAFIQPSIGFSHNIFDIALTTRFSYLHYGDMQLADVYLMTPYVISEVVNVDKHRGNLLFEPALTTRLGWKYVKLQLQFILSRNLTSDIPMNEGAVSLGLYFSLANRFMPTSKE